jgi:hypothetical protein
MKRFSIVAAVVAVFAGMSVPAAAQAPRSLLVINQCFLPVSIAVRMRDLSQVWVTRGWGNIQPNSQRRFNLVTDNAFIYYYAMSNPRRFTWNGNGYNGARMHWIVTRSFVHSTGPMHEPGARQVSFRPYRLRTDTTAHQIRLTCN